MSTSNRTPRARRLTAIVLLVLLAIPPLSFAPSVSAAPGQGWSVPFTYSTPALSLTTRASLASGPGGLLFAVWDDNTGGGAVWASTYSPGTNWTAPVKISGSFGWMPTITADSFGNAFAAWIDVNSTYVTYGPVGAFYLAGSGWRPQVNLTGPVKQNLWFSYDAVMDDIGNAYVMQRGYDNSGPVLANVTAGRANIDGTVEPTVLIESTPSFTNVAMTALPTGGALIVWGGGNGTSHMWATQHTPGSGWSAKQTIESSNATLGNPTLAADGHGNAMAVWPQVVGTTGLQYNRFIAGSGWSGAASIPGTPTNAIYPDLSMTRDGLAVVGFTQGNLATAVLAAARFLPDLGWMAASITTEPVRGQVGCVEVDVDASGNALIGYLGRNGGRTAARAAEYTTGGFLPSALITEPDLAPGNSTANTYQKIFVKSYGPGRGAVGWIDVGASPFYRGRLNFYARADTTAPFILFASPLDGTIFTTPTFWAFGLTEPGSEVTMNGLRLSVSATGFFFGQVTIPEGGQGLQATATDKAGNTNTTTIAVGYTDPRTLSDFERAQLGKEGLLDPEPTDEVFFSDTFAPVIKTNARGAAVMAWVEYGFQTSHVYGSLFAPGVGWSVPTLLDGADTFIQTAPRAAIDDGGNATVVWTAVDMGNAFSAAFVAGFQASTGLWFIESPVSSAVRADGADVAVTSEGKTIVVWSQRDTPSISHLYGLLYAVGTPPSGAQRIEGFLGTSFYPAIATDGAGRAYVAAAMALGPITSITLTTYTPATGWDGGQVMQSATPLTIVAASDAGGNLTVGWTTFLNEAWLARNLHASGWQVGVRVAAANSIQGLSVAAADDGSAAAAYAEFGATRGPVKAVFAAPGGAFGVPVDISESAATDGSTTAFAGGKAGQPLYLLYDQYVSSVPDAIFFRTWDTQTGAWSASQRLSPTGRIAWQVAADAMPDGGFWSAVALNQLTGGALATAIRYIPPDVTAPLIDIAAPLDGARFEVSSVTVRGATEPGATVSVNGAAALVADDGSFTLDVALRNGTNAVTVMAVDAHGNWNFKTVNVTFDDPDRRRIEDLEAANAALEAALAAQNASLLAALAAQNTSLLARIAQQNASLFAALAAQNASLLATLADLNSSLLASIAAGDADLAALIADTNASLLAALALQDAALLQALDTQNASLLDTIARTNATLWAQLTAEDGRLWSELNTTAAAQRAALAGTNSTVADAQHDADAAGTAAQGANTMALLGILVGIAGVGLALMGLMQSRRALRDRFDGPSAPPSTPSPPPAAEPPKAQKAPEPEVVAELEVVPPPHAKGRGRSMETQADIAAESSDDTKP